MSGTRFLATIAVFAAVCQVAAGAEPRTLPNRYSSVLVNHHRSGCTDCASPAPSYVEPSCAAPACCVARPCGGCNRCCPGILPAIGCGVVKIVRGVGSAVSCLLPCGHCCGPNDCWTGYQPSCCARPLSGRCCLARPACQSFRCCNGCDTCRGGSAVSDPFHDEPEIHQTIPTPVPAPEKGANRQRTSTPHATAVRSNTTVTKKAPTPATPRTFVAKASATELVPAAPRTLTVAANQAKKLAGASDPSDSKSSRRSTPHNPLRD